MEKYRTNEETLWGQEFGHNLQKMIRIKKSTQAEVATKIGISRQIFSRYIHGTAIPSAYKTYQIATVLECDINELIKSTYSE